MRQKVLYRGEERGSLPFPAVFRAGIVITVSGPEGNVVSRQTPVRSGVMRDGCNPSLAGSGSLRYVSPCPAGIEAAGEPFQLVSSDSKGDAVSLQMLRKIAADDVLDECEGIVPERVVSYGFSASYIDLLTFAVDENRVYLASSLNRGPVGPVAG